MDGGWELFPCFLSPVSLSLPLLTPFPPTFSCLLHILHALHVCMSFFLISPAAISFCTHTHPLSQVRQAEQVGRKKDDDLLSHLSRWVAELGLPVSAWHVLWKAEPASVPGCDLACVLPQCLEEGGLLRASLSHVTGFSCGSTQPLASTSNNLHIHALPEKETSVCAFSREGMPAWRREGKLNSMAWQQSFSASIASLPQEACCIPTTALSTSNM